MLPYEAWLKLFTGRLADSPNAGDFLASAAAWGDLTAVKTFLARGTPVDARGWPKGGYAAHIGPTGSEARGKKTPPGGDPGVGSLPVGLVAVQLAAARPDEGEVVSPSSTRLT